MNPHALVGNVLAPEPLGRTGVVIEGGKISDVLRSPRPAELPGDRARAGIIVDGVHAHEGALRVAYRQKGPEGLALVTDAMEAAGMPPGEYELGGRKLSNVTESW